MQETKRPIDLNLRTETLARFAKNNGFTERETDVFILLAGKIINSTELGKKLGVSHHTVSNHLKNIFQKTKVGNKAELLAMFICDILARQNDHEVVATHDTSVAKIVRASEAV